MKVYMSMTASPEGEELNNCLLNIISILKKQKSILNENDYGKFVVATHDYIRKADNLPNKMFTLVKRADNGRAELIFFDKEPDGNYYKLYEEESEGVFRLYIEVEE